MLDTTFTPFECRKPKLPGMRLKSKKPTNERAQQATLEFDAKLDIRYGSHRTLPILTDADDNASPCRVIKER